MRCVQLFYPAVLGTVGLVAASMFLTRVKPIGAQEREPERVLTPAEELIVRDPCPSKEAISRLNQRLQKGRENRRRLELLPPALRPEIPDIGGMGWALPDAAYWRQIPAQARNIPADWSVLPAVRYNNTQIDGVREIRLSVQGDYDLWLLRDPLHELTACISVHRPTRRVWFMEITPAADGGWLPKRSKDSCYSCHPSGPRLIRPILEPGVESAHISQFNRRMLSYGACDFGSSVNTETRGVANADDRCSGCHNGVDRGKLYAIHDRLIQFKTEQELTMPPLLPNAR